MKHKVKIILSIPIILVFVLLLQASTHKGNANQLTQGTNVTSNNSINDNTNIYLPCVENDYCNAATVESPFSINISALHQITGTNTVNQQQFDAWYNQAFPSLISALKDSGAGWTRIVIRWFDIEPNAPELSQPPIYNADMLQWYDNRLGQISQTGVKMIAVINSAPAWANDSQICPPITEAHLGDYQQFVSDLVTRYSQAPYNIQTWEIFNEADNANPTLADPYGCFGNNGSLYSKILSRSYPTIKNIDPSATVLMSGIAYENWTGYPYYGSFDRYFPDDVMISGGASFFDALNFHYFPDYHLEWERWNPPAIPPTCSRPPEDTEGTPYSAGGIDVIAKKNFYTNRMSTCFGVNKPVWLTELSQHGVVGDEVSLRNQAYYVIRGYTRSLAAGIKNITWYALADNNDGFDQSLLKPDLTPKPGFFAYKNLAAQLTNYRYDRVLNISGGEGYVFKNSCGDEKIIAWGTNVQFNISPANTIEVTDYLGGVTLIKDGEQGDGDGIRNGSIQITLSKDTIFPVSDSLDPTIPVFIQVISP